MLRSGRAAAMRDEPIAIVGASCRFPGADGLDAFWQLLVAGVDAVGTVDAGRWATRFFYHPDRSEAGKSYSWAAGLIDGIDQFEPSFFGISPREAAQMDPQQRLLLELVWHAFEDAGIPPSRFHGSDAGVYIGASATDYSDLRLGDPAGGDSYFMTGNALSLLANRISYVFDLRGPSLAVDTACSSSLVALHHACEGLRAGLISSAIVGGVNLLLTPYPFLGFCRASMLSRRGHCFAFDERADGYVRGEGAGVVILKPLAEAVAARDPIRAVILATGSNSDGRTIGVSLPSEAAQAALLRSVYDAAGVAADDLAFFEMHGTGTPAGDPVETAAVGRALAARRSQALAIGSVKTNIGHLEPASGMAGLLKAALALDHGIVPPTLHCETPNPKIDFTGLNLRLAHTAEPIPIAKERRVAGVNSFGFGGTNAHVVLAAAPYTGVPTNVATVPPMLVISAAGEASLRDLAAGWRAKLAAATDEKPPGWLRAAACGRDHHRHRLAVVGSDGAAIAAGLAHFLEGRATPELAAGTAAAEGKLAFVFSGNGAQFHGMGGAALRTSAAFRGAVESVDQILQPELGWSVTDRLERGVDARELERTDVAQPLLFTIQVGLVRVLREAGIIAQGHIGHSVGEIAAAWAAGALSLADAARVVIARSRSQQRTQGAGRMAALALGEEAARDFLVETGSAAEIAALNAARSVTISGTGAEIEKLAAEARSRGIWCRPLDLDFAFHSRLMEPVRAKLLADLAGLSSQPPAARLVSTVTGAAVTADPLDAEHWWRNIRNPVHFARGTAALIAEGYRFFVEIGPTPILNSYLVDGLRTAEVDGRVLASLTREDRETDPFPGIAARCYVAGCDLSAAAIFDGDADPRGLPLYSWNRERFWLDKTVEAVELENPPFDHPLLGFRQAGPLPYWLNHLDDRVVPWIADHALEGVSVFPAAAVIEQALAAARWRWPDAPVLEAFDVELRRPLPFDRGRMREMRMALVSDDGDWELASRPRLSDEPMTTHAVGRIAAAGTVSASLHWPDTSPTDRIDGASLYRIAANAGLDYGSSFRTVEQVDLLAADRAVVHFAPTAIDDPIDGYVLHPTLLDGALQGLLAMLAAAGHQASFLPWRFARVRVAAPFGRVCRTARLKLTRLGIRSAAADLELYDEAGGIVAELRDCWFRKVELGRRGSVERLFHVDLLPAPLAEHAAPAVLESAGTVVAGLAAERARDSGGGEQGALVEALIGAVASELLREFVKDRDAFSVAELVDRGLIAPASSGLAECLLRSLENLGGAVESDEEWRTDFQAELPDPAEIWRLLLADAPDLVAELALLATARDDLPRVLVDGPGASRPRPPATVDHLLQASPASVAGIDLLCAALGAIAGDWPAGRPLRIVEIGALGTLSRRVLQSLAPFPLSVVYRATSADPEEADRLKAITRAYRGASAGAWTPGEPSDAVGDERFDIVLMANAAARMRLDAGSLAALRERLAPGGLLIAFEPEPNPLWDIVFGQTAGWWLPGRSGAAASPLRYGDEWQAELAAAGFHSCGAASIGSAPWPSTVVWGSAPAFGEQVGVPAVAPRPVVLFAAETRLRGALLDCLAAAGHQVTVAQPGDPEPTRSLGAGRDGAEEAIVVLSESPPGEGTAQQIAALARIAHMAEERRAALWVVTDDAQQPAPRASQGDGLVDAGLWGLGRVLANELPRLAVRLIDLSGAAAPNLRARQIADEIAASSPETEVAWTPQGRHVLRLRPGMPPRFASPKQALALAGSPAGGPESLGWETRPARSPGQGEVEIEVHAAGLNFRDVMWAMGLLPEEALIDGFAGARFGLECSGSIRALGAGVEDLAVGDRVMAFAPAALGTRVVTVKDAVAPIPTELGFAAAATLPVAFVTVIYALGNLAQLEPGERVLIHAASGGVGLAAIQYAKHRGAVVVATAGSTVKREFLRLAGADYVLDSRDLGFADAVRVITGGDGVDVVLNSLGGEAMERSLEVLKPFGRFLELGKRDLYLNRRLHLRPMRQNVSYFAIDVDQLPLRRPALARSLLRQTTTLLAEGAIRPLAHRVFRYSEVDEAFRLMQSSGHIGKLVLVPDRDRRLPVRPSSGFTANDFKAQADGTYLVTGGIDGFGFEAARWLAANGAGAIALLGRRGAETPGCAERVAELKRLGAEIQVHRGDVADRASLAAVLDRIRATLPPLRGVVHAASAIDDRLTADLDPAGIAGVLRPKLDGALLLDALTRRDPIELFVLFSSATTLLGAPGQGAYVAANLALEALARRRHAKGLPALAVAWGPIEDAGYLAQRPEMREALARRLGAKPIPAVEAMAALPALLGSGLPVVGCAEARWGEARRFLPTLTTPLFSEIGDQADLSAGDDSLAEKLRSLGSEAALDLLRTVVAEESARILRLPAGDIDPARPLSQLGMDSLMAVELRLALEARLRIDLPLVSLAEGTSVASIAARLGTALAAGAPDAAALTALAARHEDVEEGVVLQGSQTEATTEEAMAGQAEPKAAAE